MVHIIYIKKWDVYADVYKRQDITVFEGTVDMDYRGELGIMFKNEEDFEITIPKHTKLAQGVLRRVYNCTFVAVSYTHLFVY